MTFQIGGTDIAYAVICQRKLWFYRHGIRLEKLSGLVAQGRLIDKDSYPRRRQKYRDVQIEGIRLDHYDPITHTVHEVKKSRALEHAHFLQLKYYLLVLTRQGISGVTGILEYPKLKKRLQVVLEPGDEEALIQLEETVRKITVTKICPPLIRQPFCRKCAYYEFCYLDES